MQGPGELAHTIWGDVVSHACVLLPSEEGTTLRGSDVHLKAMTLTVLFVSTIPAICPTPTHPPGWEPLPSLKFFQPLKVVPSSERIGNNFKGVRDVYLKAKTKIVPCLPALQVAGRVRALCDVWCVELIMHS